VNGSHTINQRITRVHELRNVTYQFTLAVMDLVDSCNQLCPGSVKIVHFSWPTECAFNVEVDLEASSSVTQSRQFLGLDKWLRSVPTEE